MQFGNLPTKRVSWVLLTSLFIFGNIVSYWAITRWGGREGNVAIAYWVETYPWLYALAIPVTVIIMMVIVRMIRVAAVIVLRDKFGDKQFLERVILASLVTYWAIANSFMNLSFLLGHRLPGTLWPLMQLAGMLVSLAYAFVILKKSKKIYFGD